MARKKKTKKRKVQKIKRKKFKKRQKRTKKNKKREVSKSNELIFKVPKKWSRSAYVNKNQYDKNINYQLQIMKNFGKKRESE